jgi:predicted nucleic acid binding AN1-type Zn finger protein
MLDDSCKCGFKFCDKHRLPFDHMCKIDYKSENIKKLEKNNKKIIRSQFDRIN